MPIIPLFTICLHSLCILLIILSLILRTLLGDLIYLEHDDADYGSKSASNRGGLVPTRQVAGSKLMFVNVLGLAGGPGFGAFRRTLPARR